MNDDKSSEIPWPVAKSGGSVWHRLWPEVPGALAFVREKPMHNLPGTRVVAYRHPDDGSIRVAIVGQAALLTEKEQPVEYETSHGKVTLDASLVAPLVGNTFEISISGTGQDGRPIGIDKAFEVGRDMERWWAEFLASRDAHGPN